jgi:glycosyltransferase involved in cell wall biosynthesis
VVLVASPYLPYPLSHGGAMRIFNLMRRAARDYDQVLVALVDELAEPAPEWLDLCAEVVLVRRRGSNLRRASERPDEVDAFDVPAFHAAVRQTVRKWRPEVTQLEHTQMAQYAADCIPARTVLVEHDLAYELCEQLLALGEDWEERRQWKRWRRFEREAWGRVDRVVTMSEKDRCTVSGPRAVCLPNGVDLQRFHPWEREPDPARVLFIGSFAHLPNVLAMEFFLREAWPAVAARGGTLHILAGARHAYYLEHHRNRAQIELTAPGIEVEDFVADVRPAYDRATVVIAPSVVSAGTNIKILEALAMGKVVVSTPAGIDGLDLVSGEEVVVAQRGEEFSAAILDLLDHPEKRRALERKARAIAERNFDWETIAGHQRRLYESLRAMTA